MRTIESDQYDIWSSIPHWPTYHQTIGMQYVNFQGTHILQHIWGSLQQHEKDTILNNAAINGTTSIIEWAINNKLCDERQLISWMELALDNNKPLVVEQLFEMISLPHKTTILDHLKTHNHFVIDDDIDEHYFDDEGDDNDIPKKDVNDLNLAGNYFSDLMAIDLDQGSDAEKYAKKQWRSIQQFKRINQWIDEGNADLLAPWLDQLDQAQKNQALLNAARGGHAPLVQLLLTQGAVDVLGNLFFHAASKGQTQVIELLLNNEHYSLGAHDAMKEAIINGHLNAVRLLEPHCDVINGMALNIATAHTQTDIVSFLVDKGAALNASYEEWTHFMTFTIQDNNDHIIPLLKPLILHHPCNWNLFEQAVEAGMLHSARSLLNCFDHSTAPFSSLLNRLLANGCADIRRLELILPFTNSGMGLLMAETVASNNWAVLDLLSSHPTYNVMSNIEAIHECIEQKNVNLLTRLMNSTQSISGSWAVALLLAAGKKNTPEIIDVLCQHHTFDEVTQAIKRLHVSEYSKGKWNDFHLVKAYQQMCRRQEIEKATANGGTEKSKRRM